jgi:hypothetical protein
LGKNLQNVPGRGTHSERVNIFLIFRTWTCLLMFIIENQKLVFWQRVRTAKIRAVTVDSMMVALPFDFGMHVATHSQIAIS